MSYCIAILISLFLIAGCTSESPSNITSNTVTQILRIGNGTEPQDLDPHIITGIPERWISVALFEGLLARNPETLAVEPAIAESWSVSQDKLTYTFHLRKNARWSNGDPLTARDFVYSWERLLHPLLGNQNEFTLHSTIPRNV